jgi:hypothetical protein
MSDRDSDSLRILADAVFRETSVELVRDARRSGTSLIVCREGAFRELEPGELPTEKELLAPVPESVPRN